ncbi:hypothetical protein BV898_01762 [Hypsibius exemplaris]|uniref:Uncharacterized protein n=1 Tax=Hypsibius exemplaris TaxID=2072580 RepID=A0A1W0X9Y6_HYPEX|nr:hypothetical protein BV898_01762 [Hypsibius exemplaris]
MGQTTESSPVEGPKPGPVHSLALATTPHVRAFALKGHAEFAEILAELYLTGLFILGVFRLIGYSGSKRRS